VWVQRAMRLADGADQGGVKFLERKGAGMRKPTSAEMQVDVDTEWQLHLLYINGSLNG